MKNSLAADLEQILTNLRAQNQQINKTLREMRKSKSTVAFNNHSKNNPEQRSPLKEVVNKDKKKQQVKKSKSFHRCKSCQFIDKKDKHQSDKKSKIGPEKSRITTISSPKSTLSSVKKLMPKKLLSPRKDMTQNYLKMLKVRKSTATKKFI